MYCKKCGKNNESDAAFCSKCGSPLKEEQVTVEDNINTPDEGGLKAGKKKKRVKWYLLSILIFIGVIMIFANIGSRNDIKNSKGNNPLMSESVESEEQINKKAQEKLRQASDLFEQGNIDDALSVANEAKAIKGLPEIDELIKKCKDKKLESLSDKVEKKFDDMEGITWINNNGQKQEITDFTCYAYIGEKEEYKPILRFVIGFNRTDWIFTENIKFKSGEKIFDIKVGLGERNEDVGFGTGIYEWIDILGNKELIKNFRSVIGGEETKIRFSGKTYSQDYIMSEVQKERLKTILDYYDIIS